MNHMAISVAPRTDFHYTREVTKTLINACSHSRAVFPTACDPGIGFMRGKNMGKSSVTAKTPKKWHSRPLHISGFVDFFGGLGGGIVKGLTGQWQDACSSLLDAVKAVGLDTPEEELAGRLIQRSFIRAVCDLIGENRSLFVLADPEKLGRGADALVATGTLEIDEDFFHHPGQGSIIEALRELFGAWLDAVGMEPSHVASLRHRLATYFVYALNDEWRKHEAAYNKLHSRYNTPFAAASKDARDWERYTAWLQRQVEEKVFDESFSLTQIYVPLNAYYIERKKGAAAESREFRSNKREEKRVVVSLEDHIRQWLQKPKHKNDALRVVSGGPGCGKSSFAKMFAARMSISRRVLYIPLHLIDLKNEVGQAIGEYLSRSHFFQENPYTGDDDLLVVFDGLDELNQQGKACMEVAKHFAGDVQRHLAVSNHDKIRLHVVITGREPVVQSSEELFALGDRVLHVLPYHLSESERENYIDADALLAEDKRDAWWKKYGLLTTRQYTAMPVELSNEKVDELTAQPLLNYLVALAYTGGETVFSADTNMNEIYASLIRAVYKRDYAGEGIHGTVRNISEDDFLSVLQEIAVSAWHGSGRTTTVAAIEKRCHQGNLSSVLKRIEEGAKAGVTNFLTAFYFRQSDARYEGEKTFEFTHKSFSEYLLSRRIVKQLEAMNSMIKARRGNSDAGWSDKECLKRWAILCGGSELDKYAFRFLCDEIALQKPSFVAAWQKILCGLVNYLLVNGMPFEEISEVKTFREKVIQSRNAEEALLATLNACSRSSGKLSKINWRKDGNACRWLSGLIGVFPEGYLARDALGYLRFTGCKLTFMNFTRAVLTGADLSHCLLHFIFGYYADFSHATLRNASLLSGSFDFANFSAADMRKVTIKHTGFSRASFIGSKLQDATISGVTMHTAKIRYCDASKAVFELSTFYDTDFSHAKLMKARLTSSSFFNCDFQNADLTKATLCGVVLGSSKFRNAILDGTDFSDADLCGSDFREADLRNANLSGANLENANFRKAKSQNTDLRGANFGPHKIPNAKISREFLMNCILDDEQKALVFPQ